MKQGKGREVIDKTLDELVNIACLNGQAIDFNVIHVYFLNFLSSLSIQKTICHKFFLSHLKEIF